MSEAEPSATSSGTQVLCHYLYSISLKHGLRPAAVAKFKLLFTGEHFSLFTEFLLCSDGLCEEGAGRRVGQCLVQPAPPALFFMWRSVLVPGARVAIQV